MDNGGIASDAGITYRALFFKYLRTKCNLTQEQLAQAIHVSSKVISNIETGKTDFTIENLLLVCRYFNVSLLCFFEDFLLDKDLETMQKFKSLPESLKESIRNIIDSWHE